MRAVLSIVLLAGASQFAYADHWSKQWTVSGNPELRVEVDDGRVEMVPGNGNHIEAEVITESMQIAPGHVTVTEHQSGNQVFLEVHIPKRHLTVNWSQWGRLQVKLRVPQNTLSILHTGDGGIHIDGVHGHIEARTGDGSIEALGMDGVLQARTGDGHVHVTGRLDELQIETGDGSVEAEIASGSHLRSDWRIHTGDGHVTLHVPETLQANLDMHTGDGSIVVTLPVTTEAGGSHSHDLRAKMNGGGPQFTVTTGDGPIHVDRS